MNELHSGITGGTTPKKDTVVRGGFALHWPAHGHLYGIPVAADAAVCAGQTVVFNASRQVVQAARARYAAIAVVIIDAPAEIRAARLAARNRERAEQVLARLRRVVTASSAADVDLTIDNCGALEDATGRLVQSLREPVADDAQSS